MEISQIPLRENVSPQGLELGFPGRQALTPGPFQEGGVSDDVKSGPYILDGSCNLADINTLIII